MMRCIVFYVDGRRSIDFHLLNRRDHHAPLLLDSKRLSKWGLLNESHQCFIFEPRLVRHAKGIDKNGYNNHLYCLRILRAVKKLSNLSFGHFEA